MSNGPEQKAWYHQPLWSGIIGGMSVAALIGLSGFVGGGGLIGALGGVTKASLGPDLENLKEDQPEIWADLRGEPGEKGAPGPAGTADIPIGAVLAFDLPDGCPLGWTEFADGAGRTIIGAGQGMTDQNRRALSSRKYREHGGEEAHTLTKNEMPTHTHIYYRNSEFPISDGNPNTGQIWAKDDESKGINGGTKAIGHQERSDRGRGFSVAESRDQGGNRPHNNMPPYIALYLCKYEGTG